MANYEIKLYTKGACVIVLSGPYPNRHYLEERAKAYIKQGHAESMGAVTEVIR